MVAARDDYDSPWKILIESFFSDLMSFFFPEAHAQIDWSKGFDFLDKELQAVAEGGILGRLHLDKLIRVTRRDGEADCVFIHVEVEGSRRRRFEKRLFVCNCRLFGQFQLPVASLVILADGEKTWRPSGYGYEVFGIRHELSFLTVKLIDFAEDIDALLRHENPFGLITAAHLLTRRTRKDQEARYAAKLKLIRILYGRGWDRQRIIDLFVIIDWMMRLPKDLANRMRQDVAAIEESMRMPYVTSFERLAREEGFEEGEIKGRLEGLEEGQLKGEISILKRLLAMRFGELPPWAEDRLNAADTQRLTQWSAGLLTAPSLEDALR
jgi:hypothetical protein